MVTLFIGGSRSGKSGLAERYASMRRKDRLLYVATLRHNGERENIERIERHRAMRAKHSFETIELYTPEELDLWCDELNGEDLPVALLDCLGIMLSQGKYVESDGGHWTEIENEIIERAMMGALEKLARKTDELIIVAPDIFKAKAPDPSTDRYMQLLGRVLQSIVETLGASVVEVIAGIPVVRRDRTGALACFADQGGR
ncbi:MAG TPA: hypothetical protein GX728_03045 [Clostridiaceae bacterium]|nr:hypothetical protein [Clostridiaceae bacterium]